MGNFLLFIALALLCACKSEASLSSGSKSARKVAEPRPEPAKPEPAPGPTKSDSALEGAVRCKDGAAGFDDVLKKLDACARDGKLFLDFYDERTGVLANARCIAVPNLKTRRCDSGFGKLFRDDAQKVRALFGFSAEATAYAGSIEQYARSTDDLLRRLPKDAFLRCWDFTRKSGQYEEHVAVVQMLFANEKATLESGCTFSGNYVTSVNCLASPVRDLGGAGLADGVPGVPSRILRPDELSTDPKVFNEISRAVQDCLKL